jgi:hypothetical protein
VSSLKFCITHLSLLGRATTDTAFVLETFPQDGESAVKLSYCVGRSKGGCDVIGWTDMGGSPLLVPTTAPPNGVPLYWTLKARNAQGNSFNAIYVRI